MSADGPTTEPSEELEESHEDGELFRREVLEEMGNKLVGEVVLLTPPGWTTLTLFYSALVILLTAVLLFGNYQRKERVPGVLIPNRGLVTVVAEGEGLIRVMACKEGDWVSQGQTLLKISRESFLDNNSGKYATQLAELYTEQSRLEAQREELRARQRMDRENLNARRQSLIQTRDRSVDIILLKQKQLKEAQKTLDAAERLVRKKIIAHSEYDQQLALFANVRQSLAEEQKRQSETVASLKEIQIQEGKNSSDSKLASDNLESRISEGKRRLVDMESQKEIILKAPADGFVSGLRSFEGQAVQQGQSLLTLVPKDLQLEGNLFVTSRAAPFIREGQTVWIQFEALAPTKYGVFPGVVQTVSQAALDPKEVKEIALDAPRYLVKVALNSEAMSHYQKELSFKAGLQLEADILLDRRSLMEWILDPLLRARGPR